MVSCWVLTVVLPEVYPSRNPTVVQQWGSIACE
jgi:hypothetical protein